MGILDGAASGAVGGSALGPWGSVIGAGIGLFGSLFGAYEQSSAASDAAAKTAQASKEAAQIQAAAEEQIARENAASQKYAADLQAKAGADALSFSKGSAENAFQNNEVARAGNYDQFAAAQRRIGSISKLLGFGDREIPAYRPGVDPRFGGGSDGGGGSQVATLPSTFGNLSDPSVWMGLVNDPTKRAAFVQSIAPGLSSGLVDYYAGKILGQPGANPTEQAGSAQYWANKIINDPTLGAPTSAPPTAPPSVAAFLGAQPTMPNPYSVATYLG